MKEKQLTCKNCECAHNSEYKKENSEKACAYCTIFTEKDIRSRKFCEEREF